MTRSRLRVLFFLLGGIVSVAHAQTCPPNNPAPVAPDNRYTVSQPVTGEFVVTDTQTGLIWKQCAEGLSGATCGIGSRSLLNWTAASSAANNATHAGFSDWRLPNRAELFSLVETSCYNSSINSARFPATGSVSYWSATTIAANPDRAWDVFFYLGASSTNSKTQSLNVRLVRGGQAYDTFASEADFTPDSFSFNAQTGVPPSSPRTSNAIIISSITTPVGIAVSGALGSEYRINNGAWTSVPGTVSSGALVEVRHTSAALPGGITVTSNLAVGAISANFASTTLNIAPSFTAAFAITRQIGSPGGAAVNIGTAADAETAAGSLTVTQIAGGTATGVTATGIANTTGAITAVVTAACGATAGTLRFQVDDGNLTSFGDLSVNISANSPPMLTYAATVNVVGGTGSSISPISGPSDNGLVASILLQSQGTYTGGVGVDNGTGVITLNNALPVGTHSIVIRALDNCGSPTDAGFQLAVSRQVQTISFGALPDRPFANGAFTVSASASSALPVTFSSLTQSICTVLGTTVTPVAAGTCSVRASQVGDSSWLAATPVDRSLTLLSNTSVALNSSANPNTVNTPLTLTATVTGLAPTGTVQFRDGGTPIAGCSTQALTGTGNTRTAGCATVLLPVGNRSLTAAYSGDGNNVAATSSALVQTISAPLIALASLPNALVGVSYNQTPTASGSGSVAPFTNAVTSGVIPAGMSFVGGLLSGVPTTAALYNFTVTATDSSSAGVGGPFSGSQAYALSVTLQSTTTTIGTISPEPSLTNQEYTVPVTVTGQVGFPVGGLSISDGSGSNCTIFALSTGAGSCQLASATAGTKTITATYSAQGSFAGSVGTATHLVTPSDIAPTLSYNPSSGTTITLSGPGTNVGNPADAAIAINVNGGSGNGNKTLGCSVSGGNFTLQSAPVGAIIPGSTPMPIALRCTRTAVIQTGSLSCNETSSPTGPQQTPTWTLTCPRADAVSPALAYAPTPGNAVNFPDGAVNQTRLASIQVTTNIPAVGVGSTALSCTLPMAPFAITGGNNQTINSTQGGVPLQLSCQLGLTAASQTLSCTETDGPSGTQRTRSWQLSCPRGEAVTLGKVTVGSKISGRGATVSIPISFKGEAVAPLTNSLTAEVSFDRVKLAVLKVQGVGGATCSRRPAPDDNRIILQRSTPGPLPAEDRPYCEVTFKVADTAPGGAIVLAVVASTCIDTGGTPRLCTKEDGRVAVAALDPAPVDGALIQIAAHLGTSVETQDLQITNRNLTGEASVAVNCALDPVNADLRIVQPSQFPLNIAAQTTGVILLSCTMPSLKQPRLATLECNTNDPMRSVMRYPVSCTTYPVGASLPAQQLLDIEQRGGEQIGTSAARSSSTGGAVTALGAPLGGSDGMGRVLVFEDAANSALRAIASIEAPESAKASEKSGTTNKAKAANAINAVSMQLGQAVALRADGSQLAVGAPFAPFDVQTGANGRGQVLLYDRPAGGWRNFDSRAANPVTLDAPPSFSGTGQTLEFGSAVAYTANGDLVIGAPGSSVSVPNVGVIFIYAWNGSSLEPPAPVTSPGAFGGGRFGGALAVRNNQIVVGAVGEFTNVPPAPIRTGTAYRIALQSGSPGDVVRIITSTPLAAGDKFGSALVITNNLLIIGASGDDTSVGVDSGSAFVFKPDTSASGWVEASQLIPSAGSGAGQEMGAALSTNGSLIFVGAPMADVNALSDRGRVYVYPVKANYAAQEQPTATLENEGGQANDEFGRAVVASGANAIVGVPKADLVLSAGAPINDVGRGDAFLLEKLFGDGFE